MILAQGDWRKIALPQSHCFRVDQPRAGPAIRGQTEFFDGSLILVPGGTAPALEIFFFRASHERYYVAVADAAFPA